MPNLAVRHGAGHRRRRHAGASTTAASRRALRGLLAPARRRGARCPSRLFAAATALAGSGPGLVAVVAEGLEEGAVAAGLTRAAGPRDGRRRARRHRRAARRRHRSRGCCGSGSARPAGTTIAGVAVLERGAVRAHVADAVRRGRRAARAGALSARWTAIQTYVNALFTVFIIVIFVRILLSFLPVAPASRWARGVLCDFVHQSTDWFLNFFRRLIPPLGMFDLSPIVALIVLYILRNLVLDAPGQPSDRPAPSWLTPARRRRDRRGEGRAALAGAPGPWGCRTARCGSRSPRRRTRGSRTPPSAPTWRSAAGVRPVGRRACGAAPAGARKLIEVDGDPQRDRRGGWPSASARWRAAA